MVEEEVVFLGEIREEQRFIRESYSCLYLVYVYSCDYDARQI